MATVVGWGMEQGASVTRRNVQHADNRKTCRSNKDERAECWLINSAKYITVALNYLVIIRLGELLIQR